MASEGTLRISFKSDTHLIRQKVLRVRGLKAKKAGDRFFGVPEPSRALFEATTLLWGRLTKLKIGARTLSDSHVIGDAIGLSPNMSESTHLTLGILGAARQIRLSLRSVATTRATSLDVPLDRFHVPKAIDYIVAHKTANWRRRALCKSFKLRQPWEALVTSVCRLINASGG